MSKQSKFQQKYGSWAVITGASAGIGEEFARQLAERGLNLVLIARREAKLKAIANQLHQQFNVNVRVAPADLSQPTFMESIRPHLKDLQIGLLVNNAGMWVAGQFLDNTIERELSTLDVNTRAPLILTHEIGQHMRQNGRGGIIFVASIGGYQGVPFIANYAATKAYDLVFSEGLWHELRAFGIDVLALSAGPTNTEGAQRTASEIPHGERLPKGDEVQPVVRATLNSIGRKATIVPGFKNKFMLFMFSRVLPRKISSKLFGTMMGRAINA